MPDWVVLLADGGVNKVAAFTAQLPAGTKPFRQLWVNGTRRTLARTPVMAYAKATTTSIVAQPGQLPTTSPVNPDLVTVVLYESWTASIHQIASIDAATLTVNLKTEYNDQWSGSAAGSRYYFQNMMEALDTPGEASGVALRASGAAVAASSHTHVRLPCGRSSTMTPPRVS